MENSLKNVISLSIFGFIFILSQTALAFNSRIIKLGGDVKYRQGVEETWHSAESGFLLRDIDSIVTGEDGTAVLETEDGRTFIMGHHTMIDIADLRPISEKDLFLSLMKEKVNKLENREGKTPLRIGTVSVVHGTSHDTQRVVTAPENFSKYDLVKNGIRALYHQEYFPNTILKVHQLFTRFPEADDCGELSYYLGSSFQELDQSGQAINAYQQSINAGQKEECSEQEWSNMARERLEKLQKDLQ